MPQRAWPRAGFLRALRRSGLRAWLLPHHSRRARQRAGRRMGWDSSGSL